ncbi:hypothetical protein HYFRA_00010376 [Hymenoscyphus fraxineus]|uniref:Heterokaryon incompatibility domain-containing protein n=1 Tax=Hymenoscyphus fraxineus TaxID=746836 RepID=A0A9N9L4D6_9HELO|nr:hypothetical protein HYFRA_00010376 [Hymenoscyphus fraxineus]
MTSLRRQCYLQKVVGRNSVLARACISGKSTCIQGVVLRLGSPRATLPILVNGFEHQVTVNLQSALKRLRKVDAYMEIWVDALSINQSDISERTEQVN